MDVAVLRSGVGAAGSALPSVGALGPVSDEDLGLAAFCDAHVPQADNRAQQSTLKRLRGLFDQWLVQRGLPPSFLMYVSGSYRLGVFSASADLDVVLVTTATVHRAWVISDAPGSFAAFLRAQGGMGSVLCLPAARVPLLSVEMDGQDVDIMTVHLRVGVLPSREDLLWSYEWMNGLDEASVRCFNGPRVTEVLIRDYCSPQGLAAHGLARDAFQTAVRLVRFWCRQRALYSNKAGFLGGVNVALLMAWTVNQLVADGAAATRTLTACALVRAFFSLLARWDPRQPLFLATHTQGACPAWLAVYDVAPGSAAGTAGDPVHLSTPCFPRFNTLHAASAYTVGILWSELQRAAACLAVLPTTDTGLLAALPDMCHPVLPALVDACPQFIQLTVSAPKSPAGALWQGFLEAQARILMQYVKSEELGVAGLRAIPVWVTLGSTGSGDGAGAGAECTRRAMFVTAAPDGKRRTHVLTGNLARPLEYFLRAHTGPPQPPGCTVTLEFVPGPSLPRDALVAASSCVPVCSCAAVETAVAVAAAVAAAAAARAAGCTDAARLDCPEIRGLLAGVTIPRRRTRAAPHEPPIKVFGGLQRAAGADPPVPAPAPPPPPPPPPPRRLQVVPEQMRGQQRPRATRVRMQRLGGRVIQDADVYVGPPCVLRGGWAFEPVHPHLLGPPPLGTPMAAYREWLVQEAAKNPAMQAALRSLASLRVGCWCSSDAHCHAAVIVDVANTGVWAPTTLLTAHDQQRPHKRQRGRNHGRGHGRGYGDQTE
jgi:hypothetical protein